jgi:hypothetical protein
MSLQKRLLIRAALWLLSAALLVSAFLVACTPAQAGQPPPRTSLVGSWDQPGVNPFKGSRWSAVMAFEDIPLTVRIVLAIRLMYYHPDDVILIQREGLRTLTGAIELREDADVFDMNFGRMQRYRYVTRNGWAPGHVEAAPAWCYDEHCIGSPNVCKNLFRTFRKVQSAPALEKFDESAGTSVNKVSEPATIVLFAFALVAMRLAKR